MKTDFSATSFLKRYFFIIGPLVYIILYLCAFFYIEKRPVEKLYIVHMAIDDHIPFCEYFVIPYFLWFVYFTGAVLLLAFFDRRDYYRLFIMLASGMTLFIIVSLLIPNGHELRPTHFDRDNLFVHMVQALYRTDTPTNLFPSIHCYNSLAADIAIQNSKDLSGKKWLRAGSFVLCWLIILATVFLKQHSVFDLLTAFALTAVMYVLVYGRDTFRNFCNATAE